MNSEPSTGQMLDRYELVAPIARGGMGSVYLARLAGAGGFQRLFAIKVMHPHLSEEREFIDMLLDEARLAARLHHPNAVPIVDVCQSGKGFYLVMDYIDGVTLAKLLSAEKLAWRDRVRAALRVILDALNGLHAAHELADDEGHPLHLVHRDVSPQNVLVGTDGVGRITDFGIALAASRIVASRPGLIKGKPSYMSPEQVLGRDVDRRADIFPVGIILWEALTAQRLFKADAEVAAMMMVLNAPIDRPSALHPEVPEALDAVCLKALERDVTDRYPSARDMAHALETAAFREGLLATSHEVADLLRSTFSEELSQRRNVLREHVRLASQPRMPSLSPEVIAQHIARQSEPDERSTDPDPMEESSLSIPAIEVPPAATISHKPKAPPPLPEALSVHSTQAPAPQPRRAWIAPVVALSIIALGGVYKVTHLPQRPSVHSSSVQPLPLPIQVPSVHLTPPLGPAPIAAPGALADASVIPRTQPVATPLARLPSTVDIPRRAHDRAARAPRDAGGSSARLPDPTIETNPYLRR